MNTGPQSKIWFAVLDIRSPDSCPTALDLRKDDIPLETETILLYITNCHSKRIRTENKASR
jgi:hypothetical protein